MGEPKKRLSAAEKELKDLGVDSSVLEARRTGEARGGVKQSTQKGVEPIVKQRQLNATEREALLKKHRQMHTPKSGSKSEGSSPYRPPAGEAVRVRAGTSSKKNSEEEGSKLFPRNLEAKMEVEANSGSSSQQAKGTENTAEGAGSSTLTALEALLKPLTAKLDALTLQVGQAVTKGDLAVLNKDLKA